jgi:diguanylate cyclase (GGDEF)-like protein
MKDFIKESGFLQNFIDAVPSLLFIVDRDVRILHVNRAASRVVGPDKEIVLMKKGGDILHCIYAQETPEGCGHGQLCGDCVIRNSVNKAYNGESVNGETASMELSMDGNLSDVYFNVATTPFSYRDNRFVLLVLDDVTMQKKTFEALNRANELLERQAMTDPLTGIINRMKFDEMLMKEISRSKRHKIPLSLVMFDIDHFKIINDTFGHHIGDAVLQQLATHISTHVRKHDYFARWGGEEFMILLTHNTRETAAQFTETLRSAIEELRIRGHQRITCSFGVTQLNDDDDVFSIAKRADEAMYKAKAAGRNRVVTL